MRVSYCKKTDDEFAAFLNCPLPCNMFCCFEARLTEAIHFRSFLRQTYKQFVEESIQIAVPNLRRVTIATKTALHTLQLTTKSAILDDIAFEPAVLISGWPSRHTRSHASLHFGFRQDEGFAFVEFLS